MSGASAAGSQVRDRSPATVGERVAAYRRRRGISQVALAALVGRSESWLSQVERGLRDLDSLSVIRQLAEALQVSPEVLLQVPVDRPVREAQQGDADPVRSYLDGYATLLTAPPTASAMTPAELWAAAESLNADYQGSRYETALARTPAILITADTLHHVDRGGESVRAQVAAYVVTAKILHKVGETRLAALAADRAASAATSPAATGVDRGLAAREVVLALLHAGQPTAAETLAVAMAGSLESDPDQDAPEVLSLRGSLLLLAAVIAARRAARSEAWERLRAAEECADRLGCDANHAWTAFGPTNVAIHAVSVAAELGDAGDAVRLAYRVDPTNLPPGLVSRRAQLHVDLAWAYTQQRRDADAVLQLLEVERVAPQLLRYQPVLRESVRELLGRRRAGDGGVLHDLAVRSGILQ